MLNVHRRQNIPLFLVCLSVAWALMGSACGASSTPSQSPMVLVSGYHFLAALKPDTGQELWRLQVGTTLIPPLLDHGVIYFGAAVGAQTGPGVLEAVRAADGTKLWSVQTATPIATALALVDGVLYVTDEQQPADPNQPSENPRGTATAYRASDGKRLWQNAFDGAPSQPNVANGVVYVATGALYAYRASDGHLLWQFQPAQSAPGQLPYELGVWPQLLTPLELPIAQGLLFAEDTTETVDGGDMDVVAFDIHTGSIVWRYPLHGEGDQIIVSNNVVFVGSFVNGQLPTVNNVTALRASDGSRLWNYQAINMNLRQPVIAGDTLYVAENPLTAASTGDLVALRAVDGSVSHRYTVDAAQPGGGYAVPTVNQSTLYTMTILPAEALSVVALNLATGSVAWHSAAIGRLDFNTPVYVNGIVYAYPYNDPEASLFAFRASDGKPLWHYPSGTFIYSVVIGS